MPLDFQRLKAIPIVEVLAKRGIALRYNGEWGSARCPLPTHKQGDNDRTFQVNVPQNFWKCWSQSCNEKAGKKGGDVINLVALLENCSEYSAAKKLAEMFGIKTEAAPHMEERPKEKQNHTSKRTISHSDSPSQEVKGYMADVDAWFDNVFARGDQEDDEQYRKRVLNAIKARLIASYRTGRNLAQGLSI